MECTTTDNIIRLDNSYVLIGNNSSGKINSSILDVNDINWTKLKSSKVFIIKIDFKNIPVNSYKAILKKLLKLKRKAVRKKIDIGIKNNEKTIIGYVYNLDYDNQKQLDFISAINAIFYRTTYDMYNYIYDTMCDYLDNQFVEKNLCDFQNNKCGEKRCTSSLTGCCHHYKNMFLGPFSLKSNFVLCEYFDTTLKCCTTKCISCKLFTCDYLEKKGVKFKIRDFLLLDTFFNLSQKYIIKYKVFTPKSVILKKLLFYRFSPI